MAAIAWQKWYYELLKSDIRNFNDLKIIFPDVSIVGDERFVFNILGNRFRLVVRIAFAYRTIQIKWFGTHAEYDKINVSAIKFKKRK